jgi:exonuclease SbcC
VVLNKIQLLNFRSHQTTQIELDRFNLFLGPTGGGKTSILDAIAYTLAGRNHWTNSDGKLAQNQIRAGADELGVIASIDGWGTVNRTRGEKSQGLTVPGATNGNATVNQARILDRFKVPQETLLAMLDPKPLLSRPPADQRDILLAILRPPKIQPTPPLEAAGITQILGVEHLDKIIKEWKEDKLRDLNRDKRKLEAQEVKKVEWPIQNHTEADVRALYDSVLAEKKKLEGHAVLIQALIDQDEEKLAAPKVSVQGLLSPKDAQTLRKQLAGLQEELTSWEEDYQGLLETIRQKEEGAGPALTAKLSSLRSQREKLEAQEFNPHCETCTCPVDQQKRELLEEVSLTETAISQAEEELHDLQESLVLHRQTAKEKEPAITRKRNQLQDVQAKLQQHAAAEQAQKIISERESPEGLHRRLEDSRGRLEKENAQIAVAEERRLKGEGYLEQIKEYHRQQKAGEEHARLYMTLIQEEIPAVERVIAELQRVRAGIMKEGIAPFLDTMAEFLAPFGITGLAYDLEDGFKVGEVEANHLSRGQSAMLFEGAFRAAVARKTGIPLIVLDHDAPVDDTAKQKLMGLLMRTEAQVLMTWTLSEKPTVPLQPGVRRFWCELQDSVTQVTTV